MNLIPKLAAILSLGLQVSCAHDDEPVQPQTLKFYKQVPGWRAQATNYLLQDYPRQDKRGQPFNASTRKLRCIKLNNYGCIKGPDKWRGAIGYDSARHTAFQDAKYSLMAKAYLFKEIYVDRGKKSLNAMFGEYAPSDDCVGSDANQNEDGTCTKYNDVDAYTKFLARNLGMYTTDENGKRVLDVFSDAKILNIFGQPNERFRQLMKYTSAYEIGWRYAKDEWIEYGIANMNRACINPSKERCPL